MVNLILNRSYYHHKSSNILFCSVINKSLKKNDVVGAECVIKNWLKFAYMWKLGPIWITATFGHKLYIIVPKYFRAHNNIQAGAIPHALAEGDVDMAEDLLQASQLVKERWKVVSSLSVWLNCV